MLIYGELTTFSDVEGYSVVQGAWLWFHWLLRYGSVIHCLKHFVVPPKYFALLLVMN